MTSIACTYWCRVCAVGPDARGPVHDERVRDATLVRVPLEPLERRVPGPGPTPGIVVVRARCPEIVDAAQVLFDALRHEVEEVLLVERSVHTTFCRSAVVAHEQDDRVVELAQLGDELEHAGNLHVRVREEAGEDLHHAGGESLLVGRQRVPGRHPRGPLRALRQRRQQPRLDLAREDLVSPLVPALVEVAAIPLDVLGRCLVRRVARARCEPEEERLVRRGGTEILEEQDRLVGEILREVVAVLRCARRRDVMVVVDEVGMELIGLAAHEAVVPLEPAPERPAIAWAAHRHLRAGREVPLPHRVGGVAVANEDLGEEAVLLRDPRVVSGEARGELDDTSHAVGVVVPAGQQTRARRRAQRGRVEVRVPQPGAGERVEARCRDVGSVAPELRVSDVVEQHDHDVRRTFRRAVQRRPPGRGVRVRPPDGAAELFRHPNLRTRCPSHGFNRTGARAHTGGHSTRRTGVRARRKGSAAEPRILRPHIAPPGRKWRSEQGHVSLRCFR